MTQSVLQTLSSRLSADVLTKPVTIKIRKGNPIIFETIATLTSKCEFPESLTV